MYVLFMYTIPFLKSRFQDNLKNENYDLDKAIETWKPLYID